MDGMGSDSQDGTIEPCLSECLELLRGILDRPGFAFRDAEILANLRTIHQITAVAQAVKLLFVRELQTRPGALPGPPGSRTGAGALTFLTEALHQSRASARRDLAAATALASAHPDLPAMATALAEGEVSREHVDVAVSTLTRIPKALKTKIIHDPEHPTEPACTGTQVIDQTLTDQARHLPPTTVERLGRLIVQRLDPDRAERFTADEVERRTCSISQDFTGMGMYRLIIDQATHVQLHAVISTFAAPRPPGTAIDSNGTIHDVRDDRTLGQRRADAITDLILIGAGLRSTTTASPAPTPHGEHQPEPGIANRQAASDQQDQQDQQAASDQKDQPAAPGPADFVAAPTVGAELCLVATVDQLAAAYGADDPAARTAGLARLCLAGHTGRYPGAILPPAVLARLACDSPIRRILLAENGAILHHGRSRRLATTAQKRALAVRDGGCAVPGCTIPAEWCDAHHIIPWENGGVTDIDAMLLLCRAHHAGIYDIQIRAGIPWVRMPTWMDGERPWLRNTTHSHPHLADHIARLLTGPDRPPTTGGLAA